MLSFKDVSDRLGFDFGISWPRFWRVLASILKVLGQVGRFWVKISASWYDVPCFRQRPPRPPRSWHQFEASDIDLKLLTSILNVLSRERRELSREPCLTNDYQKSLVQRQFSKLLFKSRLSRPQKRGAAVLPPGGLQYYMSILSLALHEKVRFFGDVMK